jgi:hypothetical protein
MRDGSHVRAVRHDRLGSVLVRTAAFLAVIELALLQHLVDTEVWLRLGGHGIDPHVLPVLLGFAAAGLLLSGALAAGAVHTVAVATRLRAVLALAARVGARDHEVGRRRGRRHDDALLPLRVVEPPVGARGPRAPGSASRRPRCAVHARSLALAA